MYIVPNKRFILYLKSGVPSEDEYMQWTALETKMYILSSFYVSREKVIRENKQYFSQRLAGTHNVEVNKNLEILWKIAES